MKTPDNFCLEWATPFLIKNLAFNSPFSYGVQKLTVFDVGANFGDFATMIKTICPAAIVHCFEPNVYKELKVNLTKYNNVFINACAVSDFTGKAKLFFPRGATALGSMIERPVFATCIDKGKTIADIVEIEARVITLDEYVKDNKIQNIDYLKIDVEGKEFAVFQGAAKTLQQKKVKLGQFEYGGTFQDAGITLKETVEFLNSKDYKVFEGPINSQNELKSEMLVEDWRWENLLFINKELL